MKKLKITTIYILLLCFSLFLSSCSFVKPTDDSTPVVSIPKATVCVTLVYNNGNADSKNNITYNSVFTEPTKPTRNNYNFDNWYKDSNFKNTYDFSSKVTTDITIYAKWTIDYPTVQNTISTTHIRACVTVEVEFYNTNTLGGKTEWKIKSGSGVIFETGKYSNSSNNYYAVLTNNHVTYKSAEYAKYSNRSITIVDYLGNSYPANGSDEISANDAAYDLSIILFTKKTTELYVIKPAAKNPVINQELVAIGQPKGQANTITYGTVSQYSTVQVKDSSPLSSNVTFPIIIHSAPGAGGSSGGPILDMNLNLIGINYAGSSTTAEFSLSAFECMCAIPIEKVNEFLVKYF